MPLGLEGVRQEWRAGDVRQRRRGGGCGQALVTRASADLLMWLAGVELGGEVSDGGKRAGWPVIQARAG